MVKGRNEFDLLMSEANSMSETNPNQEEEMLGALCTPLTTRSISLESTMEQDILGELKRMTEALRENCQSFKSVCVTAPYFSPCVSISDITGLECERNPVKQGICNKVIL